MQWVVHVLRWLVWALGRLRRRLRRPAPYVSFLLESPPPQLPPPPIPWWRRPFMRRVLSLQVLARQLRAVAADPRVRGVVVHLRPMAMPQAQAEALAELLTELRAAGKRVVCWSSSYTNSTYRVACAGDEVLLQPGGSVGPLGLRREYAFFAEALQRVGVEADFVQVSPYKTAADMLARSGFSPEAREMANWLADAAFDDLVGAIAAGRGLDLQVARSLVDGTPCTDREALELRAVDAVVSEEELPAHLGFGLQTWQQARRRLLLPPPTRPGRWVGLIRVEGLIVDGRSRRPPTASPLPIPLLFEPQCGDLTVVEQARRLAADRRVGAVVLWVNSGGGSATASEAMAAALAVLARRKPLVAAMGPVAASGGYYVATPAARVFAQPGTLTGSIGVLAGKLVAGGLLERLWVRREVVSRGAHAGMFAPEQRFSDEERSRLRAHIERVYELFLERVSAGRGRPASELEPVAGGRVWTGRQAAERGLVDELGGLEKALAEARRLGGLPPDAPLREVAAARHPPAPSGPMGAALVQALSAMAALNQSTVWLLCPWLVLGEEA